jgi:chromosome partitioning protein
VRKAETIVVPVLPSPIDIKAAERFIDDLLALNKVADKKAKAALVANRVKENTLIFEQLDEVLSRLKVPYVASLREAQNYIRAYQRGVGIHELPPYLAWPDWEQWDPLIEWLDSRRSQPKALPSDVVHRRLRRRLRCAARAWPARAELAAGRPSRRGG